jgi:hypothetical protein
MADQADQPRRRLPGIGGMVTDSIGDVLSLLSALPEIAGYLRDIHTRVGHMDDEVTGMHAAVERLDGEVRELRAEIAALTSGIGSVVDGVGRLEPHVADLSRIARPLQRVRTRLGGNRPQDTGAHGADAAVGPTALPEPADAVRAAARREPDAVVEPAALPESVTAQDGPPRAA